MSKSVSEILNGGGSASAKWDVKGTIHRGKVTDVKVVQARNVEDGQPAFWKDGSPKEQLVVTLQTDERDPENPDDDGERALYLKGGKFTKTLEGGKIAKTSLEAVRDALKAAGSKDIDIDADLALQYVIDGDKTNPAFSPPKLFVSSYQAPVPAAVNIDSLV